MNTEAQRLFAQADGLHRQGHLHEAIETLREALALAPHHAEGWYQLGYALRGVGDYAEAFDAYGHALTHGVARPEEAHLNRAVLLADHLRRDGEVEAELHSALTLAPHYLPALLNLGNLHEEHGRRAQALTCYARALAVPDVAAAPHQDLKAEALARSTHLSPPPQRADAAFDRLREAAMTTPGTEPGVRANLFFAIGKACDRLGDVDGAFEAFAMAKRHLLREHGRRYDRAAAERFTDALIQAFPMHIATASATHDTIQPLFICGLFRSGSTLLEQILATQPQVTPGGEIDHLLRVVSAGELAPFPASMQRDDPARDARIAADYLDRLRGLFPQARGYITDKRPDNFLLLGLLLRLFPHARILHTVRDPLDTGLSMWMQHLNPQVASYSADLADIGHAIGEHDRLMAHFKRIAPHAIHTVVYEDLVRDPHTTLPPVFAHLGLGWDPRCLQFHEAGNAVKTASYWQVREPLNAGAVGRWRRYEPHLRPLAAALETARARR